MSRQQDDSEDDEPEEIVEEPAQVLVIDDQEISRNSVARLLRSAGISVIGAPSAIGATRLALRRGIQVAVIDLNMPAMRGSSLVRVIRKSPRLAHVGIVLLSGASDAELVMAAGEVGADAAISKLSMADTLVPAVQKLLARTSRIPQQSGQIAIRPRATPVPTRRGRLG
jgi:DNA-binding NarL/FixJ family response regulator